MSLGSDAIRVVSRVLYHSGLLGPLACAAAYIRGSVGFQILTFHRVDDDNDPFLPALPTGLFAERIRHIARHYTVLTVEDLAERVQQKRALPARALALTFDDGYRDNLTKAAPILARHGLPATIFLATGHIGLSNLPWYDHLAVAFKTATRDHVILPVDRVLPLTSTVARLDALKTALAYLKRLPDPERRLAVDRLITGLAPSDLEYPRRLMLDWEEVDALRGLGFSIGAHTVSHPILSRMAPGQAWSEIHGSKTAIEKALGVPVRAFAYPNGGADDYNGTVVKLVRDAGFTCAVTTRWGLNTRDTPLLELRRGGPSERERDLPSYAAKLACFQLAGA